MFAGLGAIESVKPSIASNWFSFLSPLTCRFVVMDSEPTAVSALKSLQSKEFKGSKLHARIKNESVLLSLSRQVAMVAAQFGIAPQGGFFNAFSSPSVFSSANMADAGVNDAEQTFRPAGYSFSLPFTQSSRTRSRFPRETRARGEAHRVAADRRGGVSSS